MEIRKIFVVGSGLMGSGIAQTAIQAGYEVILNDQSKAALERGQAGISKRLERLVEKGRMTAEEKEACMGRLTTSVSVHVASNVDMVIEAIYENLEAKQSIFQQLDKICDSRTIFASNTSSISMTSLAAATSRPEKVVGMHFFPRACDESGGDRLRPAHLQGDHRHRGRVGQEYGQAHHPGQG